jgi:hypothetical protein
MSRRRSHVAFIVMISGRRLVWRRGGAGLLRWRSVFRSLPLLFAAAGGAGGCGPRCPSLHERRADLAAADRAAGSKRIALDANVVAQVNQHPAIVLVRIEGATPGPLDMVVTGGPGGSWRVAVRAAPKPDGSYRLELTTPDGKPLPAGVYRLSVEAPEPLEASFEVRHCVVYY